MRQLKAAANGLTDEASQLRYKLSQARGQGELLRSQIVQSPQKVQALLAEISAAVERERGCVADAGGCWASGCRGWVDGVGGGERRPATCTAGLCESLTCWAAAQQPGGLLCGTVALALARYVHMRSMQLPQVFPAGTFMLLPGQLPWQAAATVALWPALGSLRSPNSATSRAPPLLPAPVQSAAPASWLPGWSWWARWSVRWARRARSWREWRRRLVARRRCLVRCGGLGCPGLRPADR